jgi:hypothetical protein
MNYTEDWTAVFIDNWRQWLNHLIGKDLVLGIEIGSFEGRSSIWFCDNILTGLDSRLRCFDIFSGKDGSPVRNNTESNFMSNTASYREGGKIVFERSIFPGSMYYGPQADFVYIDGSHTGCDVMRDTVIAWDMLRINGIIIWDDYTWQFDSNPIRQPGPAIDSWMRFNEGKYEVLHKGVQVCIRRIS